MCTQTCITAENPQRKQKGVNTGESRDYLLTNKVPFSETWQLQTPTHPPFLLILHKASRVGIHCNIQGGICTPDVIGWLMDIKTGMKYNHDHGEDMLNICHFFLKMVTS